jgi:hypothetical protein
VSVGGGYVLCGVVPNAWFCTHPSTTVSVSLDALRWTHALDYDTGVKLAPEVDQ